MNALSRLSLPVWNRLTFSRRLLITASLALVVAGMVMLYTSTARDALEARQNMEEELQIRLSILPQLMSEMAVIGDYATMRQMLAQMVRREIVARVRFQDRHGAYLESASPRLSLQAPEWFRDWLGLRAPVGSVALNVGGRYYGDIHVELTDLPTVNREWRQLLHHLSVLLLAIVLDFIGIWLVLRNGLRPLRDLDRGSRSLGQGDLSVRLPELGAPELREAIIAFNHMADRLEVREAGFRTLTQAVEQSPVSVMITDPEGQLEYVNPRFFHVTGYTRSEVLGRNPRFLQSGRTPPSIYHELWGTLRAGEEWRGELINKRKDGTLLWESAAIAPVRDANGTVRHYVAVKEDFTQRRQLEESLRKEEDLMRSLLASMGEGVYGVDREGRCAFINPTALRLLGYPEGADLTGTNLHELIHHHHPDGSNYALEKCHVCRTFIIGEAVRRDDEVFFRADCSSFPVEYHAHPLREGEQVSGAVVTFSDITQRRRTEQSLIQAKQAAEEASRAKSAFLAIMSHEIRTPLNAILGMAELLAESNLDEEQRLGMKVLRRAGNGLLSLITDILDLVAFESGQPVVEFRCFNLADLAQEAQEIHAFAADKKGLRLDTRIDPALPGYIWGDPKRLRQVLLNLIGNAVKFTAEGEVRLEIVRGDSETIRFSVYDTGIGISREQMDRLFEPFFKIDSSSTRQYGGTGLGLAICRQLVEVLKGTVGVESREGEGSQFYFDLPLRACQIDRLTPETPAGETGSGASKPGDVAILLAEDAEDNRMLIQSYLKKVPCRLTMARDGAEAVRLFKAQEFNLLLMDIQMPGMDGLQATRTIRAWEKETKRPHTPILALTAHAMPGDQEKSRLAGCDEHLIKPIRKRELLEVLGRYGATIELDRPRS
ncbi:MAG: PAS domain S-box protein [Magnetococcales bacterium]|nr:PAS domain S-box protein [Magnetococcales bacterium]